MSYFLLSIILLALALILDLYNGKEDYSKTKTEYKSRTKNKKKKKFFVIATVINALIAFINVEIPKPEIYTTNGNSLVDNDVYIKTSFPLTIKYSLTPYEDPQKNGITYKDSIAVDRAMSVSAKASFFGIKWSDLESIDITIGSDGQIDIIETQEPGTSIKEINARLTNNRFFPGDIIQKNDIYVEGKTIAGETVIIQDFDYASNILVEGENEILVTYKNLSNKISYIAYLPKLISLNVEYIGDGLQEGDIIEKEQFQVFGIYENGEHVQLNDFILQPSIAEKSGELDINFSVDNISTSLTVSIEKKEYAFSYANELHTPNGGYDPNVSVAKWVEGSDYSIDGKTFKNGIKLIFDNWMSGLMGNGTDFAQNVESNIYIAVNQNALLKLPEEERYLNGHFVISRETNGSPTTATIIIYADGEEVYRSDEINAASTQIPSFHIAASEVEQILIQTKANVCGNDFIIGMIFE